MRKSLSPATIVILLALLIWGASASAAETRLEQIWQLSGFRIKNHQREYARFPELKNNAGFDQKSGVFTYEIRGGGDAEANIPQYLGSSYYRFWMPPDECVTGLNLVWNEESGGFRKVEFHVAESRDRNGLPDDFRAALPDGQVVYFQLPKTTGRALTKTPAVWVAEFAVRKGVNRLLLEDVMNSRENFAHLDGIRLIAIDQAQATAPVIEAKTARLGNVFHPGESASAEVSLFNTLPKDAMLKYEIADWTGKTIGTGKLRAANGATRLVLPSPAKGWFRATLGLVDAEGRTLGLGNTGGSLNMDYVVIEKPVPGLQPDSFFGCVPGELGAHEFYWKEGAGRQARLIKLAGFGWTRVHSFNYGIIQPERDGRPNWTMYDSFVEIQERAGLCILGGICYSPKWATDSTDDGFNISGHRNWSCTTPDIPLWRDWCGKIAEHYKGRIKYWEIWNEAAYKSAYWLSGSASEYAALLASSHEAIKAADPDALTYPSVAGPQYRFIADVLNHLDGKRAFDLLGIHYCKPETAAQWHATLGKTFDSPLINTEEGLRFDGAWPTDSQQVERVMKLAAYPAHGIVKTMLYGSVDPGLDSSGAIIRSDGSPRPAFAAMRTLTHRLEGARFVGFLPLGPEVKACLFAKGSTPLVVAWCERKNGEERTVERRLHVGDGKIIRIDPMDNETPAAVVDGVLTLGLSSMPLCIEGGELAALKDLCALDISVTPEEPVVLAGKKQQIEFSLTSRSDRDIAVELEFSTGSDLGLTPRSETLVLKAGEAVSLPLEIDAARSPGREACPIDVRVQYKGADGKDIAFTLPLIVNTTLVEPGENLLGAFTAHNWSLIQGASWLPDGGVKCVNPDGKIPATFILKTRIPVLPGDRYALTGKARRGDLETWSIVQYSLFDDKGDRVFPDKQGGNLLTVRPGRQWKTYGDSFKVEKTDAKRLGLFFLTSYGKPGEICWDDIRLIQLTGKVNLDKAMWQADCVQATAAPKIDADLSDWQGLKPMPVAGEDTQDPKALGYARWDNDNLYLAFRVRDSKFHQPNSGFKVFEGDAIEFAVDPTMDGKDYNEYSMALTPEGAQLFNRHSFSTPELLPSMAFGVVKDAEVAVKHGEGFTNYELRLPLTSVHPLSPKAGGCFGFSWVVDDNNGDGRKFQEWAGGIARTKDPSKYGMLRCVE